MKSKKCKICSKKVLGRSDKIFCSLRCKNYYHTNLRSVTNEATRELDEILHRNRSILLEIMGKKKEKLIIERLMLEKENFKFKYHTHTHINKEGKIVHWVYDFGWMQFSNDTLLVLRNSKP